MERRKSPRSKRPIQSEGSSHETSDDEISSGSKSTTNSRRSSPKKIKRDNRKAIVQSINWKCSPQRIAEIIKKLTPRQVQWVKDMGFQSVLDMHPYKLPRRLLLWLVKRVDCKTKSLVLRNRRISILDAVQNILQFPAGEIQVQMPPAGNPRDKAFMKLDKFRPDKAGRGQTLAEEEKELLSYKNPADKDKFCFSFMEVLLCGYLAPTTCYNINRSYLLGALSDMSQVPLMNWCHFAVDYLIRDIKDTRTKTVRNLNLQGCLHILIVMLADLVKNSILSAPPGTPRIKYITSDMTDQLETNCRKRDRDDEELFESLLDEEKLAKFPVIESNDICEEEESSSNAQADSTEENDAEPSRRCSRVMSNNQVNLIAEMIAIDERYSIERSKVMKNYETKLRKKLEELDSKRLNELKCLFKRVDKSIDKDADSDASDENRKLHQAVSSPCRNSSKSIQTPKENEQIRVQSSNSSLQQSVPNNNTSAVTSNAPDRSPLQETVDIAAAASEMANMVSEKEGVDLDHFQPGQAKKKKFAVKKTNKNAASDTIDTSLAVKTSVATIDPSYLSGDVDLSTNTRDVVGKSYSAQPAKAITHQKKVTFAPVWKSFTQQIPVNQ